MRAARISLLSLMTVAVVAALDCMAVRLVLSRPDFLIDNVRWAALMTLPMLNVLAVTSAMMVRGRRKGRAFLVGFAIVGWGSVGASLLWQRPILDGISRMLVTAGGEAWVEGSAVREALLIYAVMPAMLLVAQGLLATLGGLLTSRFVTLRDPAPALETGATRSRLVPLAIVTLLAVLPVAAIEGYLRIRVDPALRRLDRGSLAVVDFARISDFPVRPPKGSPIEAFASRKVRVEADAGPWVPERCMSQDGTEHYRDLRAVTVTLLDGDRAGEKAEVPHCVLRPTP